MAGRSDIMAGRAFVELYVKKEGLTRGLTEARQRLNDFGNAANAMGRTMIAMGLAAGTGIGLAGRQFIAFDDQMRAVKAAVGGTEPEFKRLTQLAKELGRTSGISAVQVGALMLELGRAGFKPTQIEQMTAAVLNLSKATGTQAARSAEIMTAAIRQFNLPATDAVRVADGLTAAANMSATSVEALGEAMSYAGPVAESLGMKLEDALAIMGTLGNIGIQGSEAGTTLRRLLTLTASEAAKMSQIFGVAFRDAHGNARPLVDMLEDVHNSTKHLGSSVRAAKFNEAFGILGIVGATSLGKASLSVRQLAADIRGASGIADKSAKEMEAGPGGALRRLITAIEGAALAFSEGLAPAFDLAAGYARDFANVVTTVFEKNQGLAVGIAKATIGLLAGGAALIAIGTAAKVAAFGLGALQIAMIPASYASGALLAILKNSSIVTASVIRGFQGIASSLSSGFVGSLNLVRTGLSNVIAGGLNMASGLLSASMAAGNAIRSGLMNVLARVPAAFNAIVGASRAAFAGATAAASKFSTELRYWLSRPFEYFKAITPLFAADLQLQIGNAMTRIRAVSAQAADGIRAAWTAASSQVQAAVGAATTYIAGRFAAVANPVAAKVVAAWQAAAGAISSRASAAWNAIAGSAGGMLTKLKARFGATLPLIQQDFGKMVGYAASTASAVVAAFRSAGPRIASGLVTAAAGAFARIRAMGATTAGMMGRGIGAGARGIGGLLSGGAGLMAMLGGSAGGVLGQMAMIIPSLLLMASSMTAMINPATLMVAAIAGGIYIWTQYSKEGKAALGAVQEAFGPLVATAQQSFAGVSTAIQGGNLALAGKIAIAGLKLALVDGMIGLGQLLIGNWGSVTDDVGEAAGDGMVTPWQQALETMAAVWDQWSAGVVKTFTDAMRAVIDVWESTVESIANYMLTKSAEGGFWGGAMSGILGVDMKQEQAQAELDRLRLIVAAKKQIKQSTLDIAEAEKTGGPVRGQSLEAHKKALASAEAQLARNKLPTDFMGEVKRDVAQNVNGGKTVEGLRKFIDELDRNVEAKAKNSEPQLPNWKAMREGAQAELNKLTGQAKGDKERGDAWDQVAKLLDEKEAAIPGVAGGGVDGNGVKGMLETKSLGATFSAAAAVAMGRGGGGGNPQQQAAAKQAKDIEVMKDQIGKVPQLLFDACEYLSEVVRNTKKNVAKAGP